MESFGERLKSLRKERNVTQARLAEELGLHVQTVSKWERNCFEPDISLWGKIASFFSVTLEGLFALPEGEDAVKEGEFLTEKLGRTIARHRKARGYSQKQLADKLSVTADNVSKWERAVACPNLETMISLSNLFSVSFSALYYGETGQEIPRQEEEKPVKQTGTGINKRLLIVSVAALCLLSFLFGLLFVIPIRQKAKEEVEAYSIEYVQKAGGGALLLEKTQKSAK